MGLGDMAEALLVINGALIALIFAGLFYGRYQTQRLIDYYSKKNTEVDDLIAKIAASHNTLTETQFSLDRKVDELRLRLDTRGGSVR
jgi:hypothetical protein